MSLDNNDIVTWITQPPTKSLKESPKPSSLLDGLNSVTQILQNILPRDDTERRIFEQLQSMVQASKNTLTHQTFHPFTGLPAEIWIKIWSQAAVFPQVITLQPTDDESRAS
jgi:hypothetical protein